MNDKPWEAIFEKYSIIKHDFAEKPYLITASQIKQATSHFNNTTEKEVRILCKQDTRESRPQVFKANDLFLLPVKNGTYVIVKGEGYVDIPEIKSTTQVYNSKLTFKLDTAIVGSSEMQHLDFAYAASLIRTFLEDDSLVLTIRGRKYTPPFSFKVNNQLVNVAGVQTEVDAGYEGEDQIVLIEAKNSLTSNVIIRQLFYPFRQWSQYTKKKVITIFFEKRNMEYLMWKFDFKNLNDYNSIAINNSCKFKIN